MSDESAAAAAKPAEGQTALGPDGGDSGSGATSEDGVMYLVEGRRLRAHPLAKVFPLLPDSEIDTLAGDIKKHGQQESVTLRITKSVTVVLDGRNPIARL